MTMHRILSTIVWLRRPQGRVVPVALVVALVMGGLIAALPSLTRQPAGTVAVDAWTNLERRPLHLPVLRPGSSCPLSPARVADSAGHASASGPLPPLPRAGGRFLLAVWRQLRARSRPRLSYWVRRPRHAACQAHPC